MVFTSVQIPQYKVVRKIFFPHSSSSASGQGLSLEELENYLGSAIIVFDLHTKQLVVSSILEVSRVRFSLFYSL